MAERHCHFHVWTAYPSPEDENIAVFLFSLSYPSPEAENIAVFLFSLPYPSPEAENTVFSRGVSNNARG